jgi:uncharacterized protein (DUF305 family)
MRGTGLLGDHPSIPHTLRRIMRIRTVFVTLTAALSLTGLAACSNGDDPADFNKADVSFAQDMIPHHRQATEMANMAESRTQNSEILELASKIIEAQQPEIDLMSGWLTSWDEEVPEEMSGMDHSSEMPGMMSSEDMAALEESSGDDFDQMFLTMMIEHHESAIEMASTEEEKGKFPDAIELARRIQKDQAAEIRTMEAMLKP